MKRLIKKGGAILLISLFAIGLTAQEWQRGRGGMGQPPKFVFLFIGDGMGFSQLSLAEAYLSTLKGEIANEALSFTKFPVMGMATTYSANSYITCSSAAGTALSTGFKTKNNMLGMAPDTTALESITYKIHRTGVPIGIVSSVTMDHATPAAFYASAESRKQYYDIALQIPQTGFEFYGGGDFINPTGKERDQRDIYEILKEGGYSIAKGLKEYRELKKENREKIMLFQNEGKSGDLPYALDREKGDMCLSHVVAAAIGHLYGTKGFFIMAEGGKIDWAGHSNDAKANLLETLDFAAAVEVAFRFYSKYPNETLIVVTADHETGGLALGREKGYKLDLTQLEEQKSSKKYPESDESDNAKIVEMNKKANVGWTTSSHTGSAVPVFAIGPGSRNFSGRMDNTEIPRKILQVMRIPFE
ncbi:MAG: alkaline phosphatase [Bacteroidales bacterium]